MKNLGLQNFVINYDGIKQGTNHTVNYIMYFIEEGEETLNLEVNYTVAKVYPDGSHA